MTPEQIKGFIKTHNEHVYDHIMLLAPSINNFKSSDLSIEALLHFFDKGGNLFISCDETSKKMGRDLVKEFGAELFPSKSIGKFSYYLIYYSQRRR